MPPVPGPDVVDLRREDAPKAAARACVAERRTVADASAQLDAIPDPDYVLGSNNWAVAGAHTAHGGALLADDMHLGISVPNTWYRASLVWPEATARQSDGSRA